MKVTSLSDTKNGVFPGTEAHPQHTRIMLQKFTKLFNGNLPVVRKGTNQISQSECAALMRPRLKLRRGDANVIGSGFQGNPIRIGSFLTGALPFRQGSGGIMAAGEWEGCGGGDHVSDQ